MSGVQIAAVCDKCRVVSPKFPAPPVGIETRAQWERQCGEALTAFLRSHGWIIKRNPNGNLCPKCGAN